MKISIIIPVYNSEKYIERCVMSLIRQTYKNIEIIIINDGSEDNTLSKCKELQKCDKRIIIIDKKNEGVSAARNDGINKSQGDFVMFIDADDWIEDDVCENLVQEQIKSNSDIIRYRYKIESFSNSNLEHESNSENGVVQSSKIITDIITGKQNSYVWLLFIKKSLLVDNHIEFNKEIAFMEDTIFYIDILKHIKSVYYTNIDGYHYFYNENSASRDINKIEKNIQNVIMVNKILNLKLDNEYLELCNTWNASKITNYLYIMYKKGVNKDEICSLYNKLQKNEEYKKIVDISNIRILSTNLGLQLFLMKHKKLKLLLLYYFFRKRITWIKSIRKR